MIKVLFIFILSLNAWGKFDVSKHPIYSHIKRVKPSKSHKDALNLSNLLYKYSKKYNTNPHISVAIGRQETGLRSINRKETVIVFNSNGYEVVNGYSDICMFQFHSRTIIYEGLDPVRLNTDLEYCVEQHAKLLKKKQNICKNLGKESWSCYHSFNKQPRLRYKKLVERFL